MPKIPTYENFQSSVAGQPNVQFQNPQGPTLGAIAAEQAGQFGQAAMRAGDAASRMAMDVQDQFNQVRVNDALNQARIAAQDLAYNTKTGYLAKKGANAFFNPDGTPLEKPLFETYGEKLKSHADAIAANLANDAQRRQFQLQSADMLAQFHGQIESHMSGQFNAYYDQVNDATAKLAGQTAQLNWSNPDMVASSINQAKAAIRSKAERAGMVGAPFDEAVLSGISAVHEGVILAALQNNNTQYATDYLAQARKKGEMTPGDILKVYGHITEADALKQAQSAVSQQTVATMPALAPTGFERLKQVRTQIESGGQGDFKPDGTPVTSTAGAKYRNQVMDATAANPGFGIKPADTKGTPQQVAAEYNRVGDELLQKLVQKYGDANQALAAYNAGSGRMDQALKDAAKGRSGSGDWLSYMPPETQAYVAKANKLMADRGPVAPRPTELDFVNGALARLGDNATPQAIKHTRDAAVQQFGMINKSLAERGDNALADAQRWVIDHKATSLAELPPQLKDALTQYAPGKMDGLASFARAQGNVATNDALYLKLATAPNYLTSLSDDQFLALRQELSEADYKQFANERATRINGGGSNGYGELNVQAINDTMRERLRTLKIDPSPKEGSEQAEQLGAIHRFVRDELGEAQRNAGKKFSDVETAKFIDGLFAKNVTFKGFFGGSESQSLLSLKPGDVPSDVKTAIRADFAKAGVPSPTDADILGVYLRLKSHSARTSGTPGNF